MSTRNRKTLPSVGEPFTLHLAQAPDMRRLAHECLGNGEKAEFLGPEFNGPATRRFKLAKGPVVPNLQAMVCWFGVIGTAEWSVALRETFDGRGTKCAIAFGSEWYITNGNRRHFYFIQDEQVQLKSAWTSGWGSECAISQKERHLIEPNKINGRDWRAGFCPADTTIGRALRFLWLVPA